MLHNCTVALKEPHSVRWLSLHEAVTAVKKCCPALVAALGEDAATLNNGVAKNWTGKEDRTHQVCPNYVTHGRHPASIYEAEQGFPG